MPITQELLDAQAAQIAAAERLQETAEDGIAELITAVTEDAE